MTRVRFIYGPARPKPRVGDTRMIRGVEHVRVLRPATFQGRVIGHQVSGGRPLFDWVPKEAKP